ncbi:11938_t:CDS:2 [Ambispora gerdemannii]|uniref:Aldehyde dehydrogenase n=1 Tax=Ambispora gerdemannii TaxID=144530 RepID=A0A9N9D2X9_9GLOM|nr:11938_t:CDS:2 [Ambispora gerdemannii]
MDDNRYTKINEFPQIIQQLRTSFSEQLTKPIEYRKSQIHQLYKLVHENEEPIIQALVKDLSKPKSEILTGELFVIKQEITEIVNNLDEWVKPEKVTLPLSLRMGTSYIRKEPKGTVLIIAPWNYPILLALSPLIGAIAAGCTVVCKPSEAVPHCANLLGELFPKYLDQNAYRLVQGGPAEMTKLLEHRFDHIFYTGSSTIGKVIMTAAAKHLTSVTLELGGKSPAIVLKDTDISITAKRIIWAKIYNCGQTCIAPDYIICERSVQSALIEALTKALSEMLGTEIQTNTSYARIINQRHFDRIQALVKGTKGRIVVGGDTDRSDLYIAPTVVADVPKGDTLMESEIFGPILPILVVDNIDEAIEFVNSGEVPLAFYPFSSNNNTIEYILDRVQSGGVCINDCLMHGAVPTIPFGGKGNSGMGSYHGKKSFDTFSHERSVLKTPFYIEKALSVRYPPYTDSKMQLFKWMVLYKKPNFSSTSLLRRIFGSFFLAASTVGVLAFAMFAFL